MKSPQSLSPPLSTPLSLPNGAVVPNRVAKASMEENMADAGQVPGPAIRALYAAWAAGGAGLILTGNVMIDGRAMTGPGGIALERDTPRAPFAAWAREARAHGAQVWMQINHPGRQVFAAMKGEAWAPSAVALDLGKHSGLFAAPREMTEAEIAEVVTRFADTAKAAEESGFTGVQIHAAHGYLISQFLSPLANRRTDRWGGSLENRARVVREINKGVRARTRPDFQLGLRLSPERFGLRLAEQRALAGELMAAGDLDWLDMSLWSVFKAPMEAEFAERPLIDWFADLPRGKTRLGVAGKLLAAADCRAALDHGADFVLLGRAAILHHDFPQQVAADPDFKTIDLPVSADYLRRERLGPTFVQYMRNWKGFVADEEPVAASV